VRVVLLFADGVGIGARSPDSNPLLVADVPQLRSLCGGEVFQTRRPRHSTPHAEIVPLNATLGIGGLPQSGTGQTAIFTGVNAPRIFGRHFGPYPPSVLRPILEKKNIFRRLQEQGRRVVFTNAFPKRFFEYVESGAHRLTVTTLSCLMAGVPILTAAELARNEGISADLTRVRWPELGHPDITPVTPFEAGKHFWKIATDHDFSLFEYWLTDHAGHSQSMEFARTVLEDLDQFLSGLFDGFDHRSSTFLFVSDHGNIEDLSTKSHTRNRVPCIIAGRHRARVAQRLTNLTHITPAILQLLQES